LQEEDQMTSSVPLKNENYKFRSLGYIWMLKIKRWMH